MKISSDKSISLINNGTRIFLFIFTLAVWYLSCHLSFHAGAVKERSDKNCVGAYELGMYEQTLKTANTICVEVQTGIVNELKTQCEMRVKRAEEERDKYLSWYKYEKSQKGEQGGSDL